MNNFDLIEEFLSRTTESYWDEAMLEDRNYVVPKDRICDYVRSVIRIPYRDFLDYLQNNPPTESIGSKHITQCSSFVACEREMCRILELENNPGFSYEQIGQLLKDKTGSNTQDAYKKYGENQIKTSQQLGLTFEYFGDWYLSSIGYVYLLLSPTEQHSLIARTLLRDCLYAHIMKDISTTNVDLLSYMECLSSDSTKARRYGCVEFLVNMCIEECNREGTKIYSIQPRASFLKKKDEWIVKRYSHYIPIATQRNEKLPIHLLRRLHIIVSKEGSYRDKYLSFITSIPPLTVQEEKELLLQYKEGDTNAYQAVCEAYLPTIYNIAKRYIAQYPETDIQDLIGEGISALCKAIPYYNPCSPARLITYAMHGIRASMNEYIINNRLVHIPSNQFELQKQINAAYDRFEQECDFPPSHEELAIILDIPVDRIAYTLKMSGNYESWDYCEEVDAMESEDYADLGVWHESLSREIDRALITLAPREADIIRKFYGIGVEEKTLEEIGIELHLTRERVRQIWLKAIRHLKTSSRSRILYTYLGGEKLYELQPGSRLIADCPIQKEYVQPSVEAEKIVEKNTNNPVKSVTETREQRKIERLLNEAKTIEESIAQITKFNLNELSIPEDINKKHNYLNRLVSETKKVLQQLDEWIILKRKHPALKMISIENKGNVLSHLNKNFTILKESSLVSSRTLEILESKINIFQRICELEEEPKVVINTLVDTSTNSEISPVVPEHSPAENEVADIVLTREIIESARTSKGGFTKQQLAALGLGWPPNPFYWEEEKVGMLITKSQLEQFTTVRYAGEDKPMADINSGLSELLQYKILFMNMNRNKLRGKYAPHKPILLLAIIDVIEEKLKYCKPSVLIRSPLPFRPLLEEKFKSEWNTHVRSKIYDPIFLTPVIHMQNEPFYHLIKRRGIFNARISSIKQLEQSFNGIRLDSALLSLMINPSSREELRKILIDMI